MSSSPKQLPQRGNAFTRWVAGRVLSLGRWKFVGELPATDRLVAVVAPHTSNWDFIWGIFVLARSGVRMNFMIKQDVFVFGFGRFLRFLGAIPVDRAAGRKAFQQAVESFNHHPDGQVLVITPEGTRRNKTSLKSGFYVIAKRADAMVMPASLNYETRVITFLPARSVKDWSFDEVEAWLDAFYAGVPGKNGYWMDRDPEH